MNFVSSQFFLFFLTTLGLFVVMPARYRMTVLLVASYIFYGFWSIPFIAVIIFTTSVDYFASRFISKSSDTFHRRLALITAISINALVLIFFKYYNFLIDVQISLLQLLHVSSPALNHLNIMLPLGISYFTFEAISYLIDTYRGKRAASNWLQYNFYIMYFPHLIAGPIVRFEDLVKQIETPIALPSAERFQKALELIIFGYFFKVVVAELCAITSNALFTNPDHASVLLTYQGVLGFATELLFDFLGYTQIARGISLCFNIQLPSNFDQPAFARNIANFWLRWQTTLSRWLFDYIYKPLGGAHKSVRRRMFAAFLTLLLAGIWHGAGPTFVLLGVYYGTLVALYHAYRHIRRIVLKENEKTLLNNWIYRGASIVLTLTFTILSGIFFRSPDMHTVAVVFSKLARFHGLVKGLVSCFKGDDINSTMLTILFAVIAFPAPLWVKLYESKIRTLPPWFKWQLATFVAAFCWIFYSPASKTFMYFQF